MVNAITLATAAVLFHDSIERLTASPARAALATATLILSWPCAVMPIYYPLLSDHLALAVAVAALAAWTNQRTGWLQALAVASIFIMPGLQVAAPMVSIT